MDDIEGAAPATTTHQENLTLMGQRRVNLIWEYTQAVVALIVTLAIVVSSVQGRQSEPLTNAFFLIIGFYFSRTNHSAIGGIGHKASTPYAGR